MQRFQIIDYLLDYKINFSSPKNTFSPLVAKMNEFEVASVLKLM